jgi:putative oxidoreductase
MNALWALGRALIGVLFVVAGVNKILGFAGTLGYMQGKFPAMDIAGYPLPLLLLYATIAVEILGGLALITGIGARAGALVLAAFTIAAAVLFHNFWAVDAAQYTAQFNNFMKNIAITGGLLLIVSQGSHEDRYS